MSANSRTAVRRRRGDGETGRRGDGETGRRGDGETGRRGDGETGSRGDAPSRSALAGLVLFLFLLSGPDALGQIDRNFTQRVSLDGSGDPLAAASEHPRVTPDGNFLVFTTTDDILGASTGGKRQVYRKDLNSGTVILISRHDQAGGTGSPASLDCFRPSISNDGTRVVFDTQASLVSGDTNGKFDVYLRDLDPPSGPARTLWLSSESALPDGDSRDASIAGLGGFVAFTSTSSNLSTIPATDSNGTIPDVFRVTLKTLSTELAEADEWEIVSLDNSDAQSTATSVNWHTGFGGRMGRVISDDGEFVLFVGSPCDWTSSCGSANCLGPGAACNADPLPPPQAYLRDCETGTTYRVSRNAISMSGFFPANAEVRDVAINGEGDVFAFSTIATNLPSDTSANEDVFVFGVGEASDLDSLDFNPCLASIATSGAANGDSRAPMLDSGGGSLVFESTATNLVSGDTNGVLDVFFADVGDKPFGSPQRSSMGLVPGVILLSQSNGASKNPDIGRDFASTRERAVYYESVATNLVDGDTNGVGDVFNTFERGFKRGDFDGDSSVERSASPPGDDWTGLRDFLYFGGDPPGCMETGDVNDDGGINVSDLSFLGGACTIPLPSSCLNFDTVRDNVSCESYSSCP